MNAAAENREQVWPGYRLLRIAAEQFGLAPQACSAEQQQRLKNIADNEMALEQLVLTSPEASGVTVPASQVEAALQQIRQRYEDDEQFSEALALNALEEEDLRRGLLQELRVEAVLEVVASRAVQVDPTEATMFYYLHPEKFIKPETRIARHILITVNDAFSENKRSQGYERLLAIASRLQQSPQRFAEQALKHSECPSGLNGGLLGELKRGILYPELDQALFGLQAGEFGGPIETELGWHLLLCEKILPARTLPLEQVLPQLQQELQQRQNQRAQKLWLRQRAARRP